MWASGRKAGDVVVPTSSLYVVRTGAVGFDFEVGDFTKDFTWREFNIDSIIPANATIAYWFIKLNRAGIFGRIEWRGKGQAVDGRVVETIATSSSDQSGTNFWLDVGDDRKIEYRMTSGAWTFASMVCLGSLVNV